MGKLIDYYFFERCLERTIKKVLKSNISRIKKKYLRKVRIVIQGRNDTIREGASAFLGKQGKQMVIVIQTGVISELVQQQMGSFLQDTIVELLRHEFAHLKYKDEKKASKYEKEIDLFEEAYG